MFRFTRQFGVALSLALVASACQSGAVSPVPTASVPQSATSPSAGPLTLPAGGTSYKFIFLGDSASNLKGYTNILQPYFGPGGIVEQRSHGRITFDLKSYADANVKSADIGRTLRSGVIDFAKVPVGTLDVPLATGADLAGIYPDFATAQRAVARFMPALDPYVQQQGLKIVGNLSFSGDVFYCRVPVKSAKDLKGLRVRVSGTTQLDLIQGLGAIQVTIDFAEVYAALQQGVIDCAVTDRASGNAQRWYEAAHYLYTLQVVLAVGTYSANLKMWQALPRDVQDFLLSVFAEVTDKQWALAPQLAQAGTDCNAGRAATCPSDLGVVASPPMNVTVPSAEDLQLVKQILNDTVIPNWLKRCGTGAVTTEQCRSIFNGTIGPEVGITLK